MDKAKQSSVPTIKELRKSGYKVRVHHNRYCSPSRGVIEGPYPRRDFDLYGPRQTSTIHTNGGCTIIEILCPDGKQLKGESNCSLKDNFCRKTGIRIALERAFGIKREKVNAKVVVPGINMAEKFAVPALQALRAHQAWTWAEDNGSKVSYNARMELCNYAQYVTARALAIAFGDETGEKYHGIPHMIVWPKVYLDKASEGEARRLVDEAITLWEDSLKAKVKP